MRVIRVGSRDSALAVIQAQLVMDAIKQFDRSIVTELVTMKTTGDKILDVALDKIGGKGLFVKELDEALIQGDVDITVHSFKDMPMAIDARIPVAALSRREDPRDVLIVSADADAAGRPVGCSSRRRIIQLRGLGFNETAQLRGNITTRIRKLDEGEYSAIMLAAAGIKRLSLDNRISRFFETEEILPAACQGIIAVQARAGEDTEFLRLFHSRDSVCVSDAERSFVAALDGGCSTPTAAYAVVEGDAIILKGFYVDETTGEIRRGMISGHRGKASDIGKELAEQLKRSMP